MIGDGAVIVQHRRRGDLVEPGEEGDVHVGDIERRAVKRRDGEGQAGEGVFQPHPVLEQQRHQADREGQVEGAVFAGQAGLDGAEITFQEQRVRVAVDFALAATAVDPGVAAADFAAGEIGALVERGEEGVNAFSGGELEIDIQVEPGGDLGQFVGAIVVEGDRGAPVAIDIKRGQYRVQLTQEGRGFPERAAAIDFAAQFDHRARRLNRELAAVDFKLLVEIVNLIRVGRVGSEGVRVMFDLAGARVHVRLVRGHGWRAQRRHDDRRGRDARRQRVAKIHRHRSNSPRIRRCRDECRASPPSSRGSFLPWRR